MAAPAPSNAPAAGAAAASKSDLVSRVEKFREVDSISHPNVPNIGEALERISKFLQEHETPSMRDCTHTVFDNFPDWWMGQTPTYKLAIAEDNALDTLHQFTSLLYDLGIPLTLTEKRTPEICFIQDVEVWGTATETVSAEELVNPEGSFARLLGKSLGDIFPTRPFLNVAVFDASGVSKTKGVLKTSVRFVWFNITVDKERATRIGDYVVHRFKHAAEEEIRAFAARVAGYDEDNQWSSMFSDAIYLGRDGVRMPLCSRAPLKTTEGRPFKPLCVLGFNFTQGELQVAEKLAVPDDLEGHEWLKIGVIRRDAGIPLTEWTPPVWNGEHAAAVKRAIYAPSDVYAPPQLGGGLAARLAEPSSRVASLVFEPRAQGEIELSVGDRIEITHGPAEGHRNFHRWMYGLNKRSHLRGWFPMSYTSSVCASSAVYAASTGSQVGSGPAVRSVEPSRRVASRAFEPQGQGEVGLSVGDPVEITYDLVD